MAYWQFFLLRGLIIAQSAICLIHYFVHWSPFLLPVLSNDPLALTEGHGQSIGIVSLVTYLIFPQLGSGFTLYAVFYNRRLKPLTQDTRESILIPKSRPPEGIDQRKRQMLRAGILPQLLNLLYTWGWKPSFHLSEQFRGQRRYCYLNFSRR